MRKLVAGIAAAGAVFAITTSASAQTFGEEGGMALSADRLFGITSYSVKADPDVPGAEEVEVTGTNISLLWGVAPRTGDSGIEIPIPSAIPRLSFDYFVIESLSLGGSLGYYSSSGETDPGNGQDKYDHDKVTAISLNPRVGYAIPLGDTSAVWLRGGLTYMKVTIDPEQGDDIPISVMQLDAEAMFVIGLSETFAFQVGPALDFPLGGKAEIPGDPGYDIDLKVMSFGAYAGLVGWF
jgi:hypothetical protein